jgi:hypothetical protein
MMNKEFRRTEDLLMIIAKLIRLIGFRLLSYGGYPEVVKMFSSYCAEI